MTGKDLKNKLELTGIPLRQIAEALNISEQNLQNKMSSADIKVSFLCKVSKALHKSIYFFLDGQDFYKEASDGNKSKCPPNPPPISISEESIIYKMYKDEKEEKDRLVKEKESKIDQLQTELREKSEELAVLKSQQSPEGDHGYIRHGDAPPPHKGLGL